MISDYSSAIWDFAITKKPQILYIYDYEDYNKEFGLYFDYNDFSPFPKVKTQEELVNAIQNYPNIDKEYDEFYNKYLIFEDGHSAEKVVNAILNFKGGK